jgi:hypothetical protein
MKKSSSKFEDVEAEDAGEMVEIEKLEFWVRHW